MAAELSERDKRFFLEPNFGHLATVSREGWPQSTVVWVDLEDGRVLVNTARHRLKARNLEQETRVALSITERENPYLMLALQGRVEALVEDGAEDHIRHVARKYGEADFPIPQGEVRVIVKIRPVRIYRYNY